MIRKLTASALVLTVAWTTTWAAAPGWAQSNLQQATVEIAIGRLIQVTDLIDEMRKHIDRSQFDLDALLEKLDFSAERIVHFVKNKIYFEQYDGLLRGAQGTLMSRAGNSLDQAVLLATLLRNAGYDARILRGRLSEDKAQQLIGHIGDQREPRPAVGDVAKLNGIRDEISAVLDLPLDEALGVVSQSGDQAAIPDLSSGVQWSEDTARFIQDQLEGAQIQVGTGLSLEDLLNQARDYFWVESRGQASESWRTIHPALSDSLEDFSGLVADKVYSDSIPEDLQHRLRVELTLTQKIGKKYSTTPLMTPWERPIANLVGKPISLVSVPNNKPAAGEVSRPQDAYNDSKFFLPLFNHRLAPGAVAFDLLGNTFPPDTLAFGAAGLFQTISSSFNDAASALGGLGGSSTGGKRSPSSMSLWRNTVSYTVVGPGGRETRFERVLYDADLMPVEETQTLSSIIAQHVGTDHTVMVAPGEYPEGYILDSSLERYLQFRPLLDLLQTPRETPEELRELGSELQATASRMDFTWFGHLELFRNFDGLDFGNRAIRSYRDSPMLLLHRSQPGTSPLEGDSIDIISNPRSTLEFNSSRASISPSAALQTGVWESFVEGLLATGSRYSRPSARELLDDARKESREFIVVRSDSELGGTGLAVSERAQVNIERDLADGYAVLIPRQESAKEPFEEAWWRIDPATGQTLAILGDGSGGSPISEEALVKILISGFLIYGVAGLFQGLMCIESDGDIVCFACATFTVVLGAVAALMLLVDFGTGGAAVPLHVAVGALLVGALKEFGCTIVPYVTGP